MGNELLNEEEIKDKDPEDFGNEYIRYGILSKKGEEKSNDDNYLIPKLSPSEGDDFYLFGVFDGHNSDKVSKYLSDNIKKLYEKEIHSINKENFREKIEEIFKNMDKNLKEEKKLGKKDDKKEEKKDEQKPEQKEEKKEDNKEGKKDEEKEDLNENKNKINIINEINEINEEEKKEEIDYINIDVDKKEFNFIKNAIKNSKDIPEDLKDIDDSELENLLLFKNLFKYNNNYLYNNGNVNYIGSSASIVLINEDSVITADLGITKCILFDKEGKILNIKENKELKNSSDYKVEYHNFNNPDEKKRIKRFNKTIDYNSLKLNFYVPASRCFGFFKYKDNDILKEENQIISCVPDVNIYDKKEVDFILLLTRGASPVGDSLKKLIEKITNITKYKEIIEKKGEVNKETDIKLSDLIIEYLKNKKDEGDKININKTINSTSNTPNKPSNKINSSIYVGKEDFGEENIIINELNNSYYKDIMSLNKTNDCHGNYNSTCILVELLPKEKERVIEKEICPSDINENKTKGETIGETKGETIKEEEKKKNEENKNENEIKKEENKNEIVENKDKEKNNEIKEEKNEKKEEEVKKIEEKENENQDAPSAANLTNNA